MQTSPKISVFTSKDILTKRFELVNGELVRHSGGQMSRGSVETVIIASPQELADLLVGLKGTQALGFGIMKNGCTAAKVVTQEVLAGLKDTAGVTARTREHFEWPAGPAWMMIDYDPRPKAAPLSDNMILNILAGVSWDLAEAPHVLAHSASSFIFLGEEQLKGIGGRRIYVLVQDGRDIPRAGKALYQRLWLAGHGYFAISAAGTLLDRSVVDAAVWQPERLDFAAGAVCVPPLEQRRPAPVVFNNGDKPLDTRTALKSLAPREAAQFQDLLRTAKERAKPEADLVRRAWIERRVAAGLEQLGLTGMDDTAAATAEAGLREVYRSAAEHCVLGADFVLYDPDQNPVQVRDLLAEPEQWHGHRFADPLEPGCYGDWRIAWANLKAEPPYIFSHAHGGCRYVLRQERPIIKYVQGERVSKARDALDVIRRDGDVFERGGELIRIEPDGAITPLNASGVLFELDARTRWQKFDGRSKEWRRCDAPKQVAEALIEDRASWRLSTLVATISAPTMLPDGRIIDREGLDARSGLFFRPAGEFHGIRVPEKPSDDHVRRALSVLWKPFERFPFVGPIDKGVLLAGIMTAITRQALPTAPAFSIVAPVAGSGKTLLARCLAILAGATPAVMPPVKEDEEMRKRLLALGRSGAKVIILDNLVGAVSSDCLCGWLTSPEFTDRVLAQSQSATVPTRSLLLLTGNNIQPRGDLCRRVLSCRIDPKEEKPWQRGFDLDPAEYCQEHRFQMVEAGMTLLRAALQGAEPPRDRLASFEVWSDTIRRAVIFAGGFMEVQDPVKAVNDAFEDDPETAKLRALLQTWHEQHGDKPMRVAELCTDFTESPLRSAVMEIAGERGIINPRILGRWLERVSGRILDDLVLEQTGRRNGSALWRVRDEGL